MKKMLLYSIPIISISTIFVSISCGNEVDNDNIFPNPSPELPNIPSNPEPDKPIVPEPDKPIVPEPDKPIVSEPDQPPNTNEIEFYFKNDQELINSINSLYKNSLKLELLEMAKKNIESSGILSIIGVNNINDCDFILPVSLSLSNVEFKNQDNIYKIKGFNLNIEIISKIDQRPLTTLSLSLFDEKWDIYSFIKQ